MDLHEVIAQSMVSQDEAEGRVYGWLAGIVTDVDTKLMRVKARVGRQGDNESTDWMLPVGMGSIESLPEVNDPIGVIFMDGDVHRGAYFYFPQSNTSKRPTEAMVLGNMFTAMYNDLVAQFNQLRSDMSGHTHLFGTIACSTGVISGATASKTTTANAAQKAKAADGSEVAAKTTSEVVLSKRSLVR